MPVCIHVADRGSVEVVPVDCLEQFKEQRPRSLSGPSCRQQALAFVVKTFRSPIVRVAGGIMRTMFVWKRLRRY
jgi:hypothetical protein